MKKDLAQVSYVNDPGFSIWSLLPMVVLGLVTSFFSTVDLMSKDFTLVGNRVLLCNVYRLFFIGIMTASLMSAGHLVVFLLRMQNWYASLYFSEKLVLRFFLGAGLVTFAMFPLGLANLYFPITAFVLSAFFLAFGFKPVMMDCVEGFRQVTSWLKSEHRSTPVRMVRWLFLGMLLLSMAVLLLTRCLYPGETSNDSYEIYWPYQLQTVASHSLAPNELWYMFCSFNGAGINFWSMLLTDLLGIQSVTYCFLFFGAASVYCVSRRFEMCSIWSVATSLVCVQCFAFTNPYWGAFQSHHIQTAAWMIVIIWGSMTVLDTPQTLRGEAARAMAWMAAAIAVLMPLYLIFVLPMFSLFALSSFPSRERSMGAAFFTITCGGVLAALILLIINYSVTGMPLQNPTGPMWKLTNEERFSRWCSPYNIHYLFEGSNDRTTGVSLGGIFTKPSGFWTRLLRLKSYGIVSNSWIFSLSLVAGALTYSSARSTGAGKHLFKMLPLIVPLAVALLITNTSHPDSVYRNYCFTCFLLPPFFCFVWWWITVKIGLKLLTESAQLCIVSLIALSPLYDVRSRVADYENRHRPGRLSDFFEFALGHISFQEALSRGDGLWAPAQQARSLIGLEKKIFSFSHPPLIASYLFPGNGLLTEPSRYGFGGKWDLIVFGDPDSAKEELQKQGINYFLIDFTLPFFGALAYSPLFDPSHLYKRFDLVGGLGSSVLLTWKGGAQPISAEISNAWYQRVSVNRWLPDPHPDGLMWRLYENTRAIYEYNRGLPLPVRRPEGLPRVSGWQ